MPMQIFGGLKRCIMGFVQVVNSLQSTFKAHPIILCGSRWIPRNPAWHASQHTIIFQGIAWREFASVDIQNSSRHTFPFTLDANKSGLTCLAAMWILFKGRNTRAVIVTAVIGTFVRRLWSTEKLLLSYWKERKRKNLFWELTAF